MVGALRRQTTELRARTEDAQRELVLRQRQTRELEFLAEKLRIETEAFVRRRADGRG